MVKHIHIFDLLISCIGTMGLIVIAYLIKHVQNMSLISNYFQSTKKSTKQFTDFNHCEKINTTLEVNACGYFGLSEFIIILE